MTLPVLVAPGGGKTAVTVEPAQDAPLSAGFRAATATDAAQRKRSKGVGNTMA